MDFEGKFRTLVQGFTSTPRPLNDVAPFVWHGSIRTPKFGDYQRQMFLIDHAGLPVKTVLNQLDLLGEEVIPVLRNELAARRSPETPDTPSHASRVKAKYGDEEPRQPRPNANRGDNVTGGSPYQDTQQKSGSAFGL